MSAVATFQIKTNIPLDIIKEKISSIWLQLGHAYSVDVIKENILDLISIYLHYYFGQPREETLTKEIIIYLFSIAEEGKIYYLRDSDFFIPGVDSEYQRPITIEDIFTKAYKPGSHDGIQYRYLIKKHITKKAFNSIE